MVIEINKDIDRYQESVAMGLSAKQLIFSIASVAIGGSLVFLLYRYIGLTAAAYVAIPVVAPIALGGFYSYNGMGFYEVMQKKLYFLFLNHPLTYVSTEGEPAIKAYRQELANEERSKRKKGIKTENGVAKGSQEEFAAMKKKMVKTLVVCVAGAVAVIATAMVYKHTR